MIITPKYILAPFVPTPPEIVEHMLRLAEVTDRDLVYDLGCGDGRVLITAAKKYGARGFGVDIEPYWVEESTRNAEAAGVGNLVRFEHADAVELDLSPATVITLYLVDWSTSKMLSTISSQVRPGTRVISHNYRTADLKPVKEESFLDDEGKSHRVYLWITE